MNREARARVIMHCAEYPMPPYTGWLKLAFERIDKLEEFVAAFDVLAEHQLNPRMDGKMLDGDWLSETADLYAARAKARAAVGKVK